MPIRTLYLIRHGQYDMTINAPDGGSLTELGRKQAFALGEYLQKYPINAIHCSTMTRAIETAQLIGTALSMDIASSALLREAIPTIPPRAAEQILGMMATNPNFTHETIHQDRKRADKAFEQYFTAYDGAAPMHELLVCHGNIIRYLTCKALGINVDTWAKLYINHCGMCIVEITEQKQMRLLACNDTRGLPDEMLSE